MLSLIDAYLEDPSLDREGRARIVDEQCGRVDGGAGLRVAALLMSFMGLPLPAHSEPDNEFARVIDREPAHMSEPY